VFLLEVVQRWVDQAESLVRVLVGDRDDAGELGRRRAGAPAGSPGSRRAGIGLEAEDAPAERGAERDARDAALIEIALRGSYLPFALLAALGGLSCSAGLEIYGAGCADQADACARSCLL